MSDRTPQTDHGIKTTVEAPQPWQRIVKAEVTRARFEQAYAERLRRAVKSHQKPGFRKGRTPRAVVEREMGDQIRYETIESLVPKAWMAALLEHKLAAITDPALENLKFEDGQPLTFDLVVEIRPEVTAVDYEGLPVRKRAAVVDAADVDQVLERLRESRAAFVKVERTAADGDQITLDLTPQDEPGQQEAIIEDQRFVLGRPQNLSAFNEQLQGCAAGEEKSVTVAYPTDFTNESLAGRTVTFACRIKEVAARELPALDDAFAAEIQEGKTLAELRTDIERDLLQEAERRIAGELDEQIRRELIARNNVSLPPAMVKRYLESGLEELHSRNARLGRPNSPQEDQQYLEAGRPHAEAALRAMLLLEAVRRQEEIKIKPEDVDDRIREIAVGNGFEVDRYRDFVNSGQERERLEYELLERRAYDFLLSRAAVVDVPADTDLVSG